MMATGTAAEKPKRKVRDKKEIEEERLNKELNRIKREITASKNSKCEQYLFCYVDGQIPDGLAGELTTRFTERDIAQQLVFSPSHQLGSSVTWKRKRIEAYVEEDKIKRAESIDLEGVFAVIVEAVEIGKMVKSKGLVRFVEEKLGQSQASDPQLTVVVHGKVGVNEPILNQLICEAFETWRGQFRFVTNVEELGHLIAQMHRAIAKMEKKQEVDDSTVPHMVTKKGIRDGPNLVLDWWTLMLDGVHRFSVDQRRAIVEKFPNPFQLMDKLIKMPAGDAIYYLAEVQTAPGARIGPVIAQKLYLMLTSRSGEEVIHNS